MYNLHVGTDTCWSIGGWNIALFGEIGYTEKSENYNNFVPGALRLDGSYSLREIESILQANAGNVTTGYDLAIRAHCFNP